MAERTKEGLLLKDQEQLDDEMALVNRYAKKALTRDEVYLFSVALCDNEVDRDFERFTVESLFELEKLFVGKTGIIDHEPSAKNQKARIISTRVEAVPGRKTKTGDDYFRLVARAYMKRGADDGLIEAIESGIVKEVSVGCAVGQAICSVCKKDLNRSDCTHRKGQVYGGELCVGELSRPSDAYEFSFVAIPSQKEAGVIKAKSARKEQTMEEFVKTFSSKKGEKASDEQLDALRDYVGRLEKENAALSDFRKELQKQVKDEMKAAGAHIADEDADSLLGKCSLHELKALSKAFLQTKHERKTPTPQLFSKQPAQRQEEHTPFKI